MRTLRPINASTASALGTDDSHPLTQRRPRAGSLAGACDLTTMGEITSSLPDLLPCHLRVTVPVVADHVASRLADRPPGDGCGPGDKAVGDLEREAGVRLLNPHQPHHAIPRSLASWRTCASDTQNARAGRGTFNPCCLARIRNDPFCPSRSGVHPTAAAPLPRITSASSGSSTRIKILMPAC